MPGWHSGWSAERKAGFQIKQSARVPVAALPQPQPGCASAARVRSCQSRQPLVSQPLRAGLPPSRPPTCSAMAYTCGLSSPSGTPRYCAIMRGPYSWRSRLCGLACRRKPGRAGADRGPGGAGGRQRQIDEPRPGKAGQHASTCGSGCRWRASAGSRSRAQARPQTCPALPPSPQSGCCQSTCRWSRGCSARAACAGCCSGGRTGQAGRQASQAQPASGPRLAGRRAAVPAEQHRRSTRGAGVQPRQVLAPSSTLSCPTQSAIKVPPSSKWRQRQQGAGDWGPPQQGFSSDQVNSRGLYRNEPHPGSCRKSDLTRSSTVSSRSFCNMRGMGWRPSR